MIPRAVWPKPGRHRRSNGGYSSIDTSTSDSANDDGSSDNAYTSIDISIDAGTNSSVHSSIDASTDDSANACTYAGTNASACAVYREDDVDSYDAIAAGWAGLPQIWVTSSAMMGTATGSSNRTLTSRMGLQHFDSQPHNRMQHDAVLLGTVPVRTQRILLGGSL